MRHTGVRCQETLVLLAESGDVSTASGLEVVSHAVVEGEHAGGGSDLSTHVADGGHAYVVGMGAHVNTRVAGASRTNEVHAYALTGKTIQSNHAPASLLIACHDSKTRLACSSQEPHGRHHTS